MKRIQEALLRIPNVPLSALLFYIAILLLWKLGILPSPESMLTILERLYQSYGFFGLFIASFLEGVVYLGMYFPGSFIVALAVIVSDGTFLSLLTISAIVAAALTLTSLLNYQLGKNINANKRQQKEIEKEHSVISKGFLAAVLHPVPLAFYFFSAGMQSRHWLRILFVPLLIIPYGIVLGVVVYGFKDVFRALVESPYAMLILLSIWLVVAWGVEIHKNRVQD